jgi:hypothetical protein
VQRFTFSLSLGESELLSFSAPTAELSLLPISLGFVPTDTTFLRSFEKGPKAMYDAYKKAERFQPILFVGSEFRMGKPFDLQGRVYKNLGSSRIAATKRIGGGIGGLFGGGRKKEQEKAPASWDITLKITLAGPGEGRAFTRRLLTSGDPEALRIRLTSSRTFLCVPGAVMPAAVNYRRLEHILENKEIILKALAGKFSLGRDWNAVRRAPLELLSFVQAETALLALMPQRETTFLPFHLVSWVERNEPPAKRSEGIDIFFAPLGTSLTGRERTVAGLRWGALLTELERSIIEARSGRDVQNAGRCFFLAQAQGMPIRALRIEEELADLTAPADLRKTLSAELKDGSIVIVPSEPVLSGGSKRWGYFAIDPGSGETLGRLAGFGGQALTEYLEGIEASLSTMGLVSSYADMQVCLFGTIAAPLAGATQAQMRAALCKCFISWTYSAALGAAKSGFFDISTEWYNTGLDILIGGVGGTDFGGLNGIVGKGFADGVCGG